MKKRTTVPYDILGISSATLCLIHCAIFPILTIIPISFSDNIWIDTLFACIGLFAVSNILISNASIKVKYILGVSLLIILVSMLLEMIINLHIGLIFIGGIGMIAGHYLNYKNHKL